MSRISLIGLAALLSGCMSTGYSPLQADSRPPACISVCNADSQQDSYELPVGKECTFPVLADQPQTDSPLFVRAGQKYHITFPRNQVWYDLTRRNVPPEGECGSKIMNWAERLKKHRDAKWFALFAVITPDGVDDDDDKGKDNDNDKDEEESERPQIVNIGKCPGFDVAKCCPPKNCADRKHCPQAYEACHKLDGKFESDLNATKTGRLSFYPNDALIPVPDASRKGTQYYENNVGQIWVIIERKE